MKNEAKELLISVEKNLRLATAKIRTDPYYGEMYLQNALQGITNINAELESSNEQPSSRPLPSDEEIEKEAWKRYQPSELMNLEMAEQLGREAAAFTLGCRFIRDTHSPSIDVEKMKYAFYGFMGAGRDRNIETSDQEIMDWVIDYLNNPRP